MYAFQPVRATALPRRIWAQFQSSAFRSWALLPGRRLADRRCFPGEPGESGKSLSS